MADETTPIDNSGTTTTVAVADTSIADIVDSSPEAQAFFGTSGTTEPATPAPVSAPAETGEGDSSGSKTDDPQAAQKPTLFTEEELGKFTLREIENPAFDWTKVPPAFTAIFKGWQADATRYRQQLADQRRQPERREPPQPPVVEDEDPTEKQNREIVAAALSQLTGITDPQQLGEMVADHITQRGVQLAAEQVPQYVEDENFQNAVNLTIAQDPYLAQLASSKSPDQIARAIRLGAIQTLGSTLDGRAKEVSTRAGELDRREAALKAKEEEIEQERTKLNRHQPSIAGGRSAGAATRPGPATMADIVDEHWPAAGVKI